MNRDCELLPPISALRGDVKEVVNEMEFKKMRIIVELELESPYDLTEEEIWHDIKAAEDQIGFNYDYTVKSVEVT